MKTKNLFPRLDVASRKAWAFLGVAVMRSRVLPALIAALNLLSVGHVRAQTFTTLHSFAAGGQSDSDYYYYNSDGVGPKGLILSGNTLYGAAYYGGGGGAGTVFAINTDGTGFTNLHVFAQPHYFAGYVPDTNPDGIYPNGLILSGTTLYGAADRGGWSGYGTLFAVNTDGTGFTNLHQFTAGGANPESGLILSGDTLYGTSAGGGGTVFAINRNGTGFTTLHNFAAITYYTNSDGAGTKSLILSGNTLYGTAQQGGISGNGTVFAVNTNGTGFTTLHRFTGGSNGANPAPGLILSGNILYGMANYGSTSGVFAVNINGTGFTNLHNFTTLSGGFYGTNNDGAFLYAGLILSGHTLYGTGAGTVFAVNTNGTGFTNLHNFAANSDGVGPEGLVLSGGTLYGTAAGGGTFGSGTVFSLSFQPQLTITRSGIPPSGIILSWPTNVAGFDYTGYVLQSTTNLRSPAVWVTNAPAPVVIAGQNTVTNSITAAQRFYRLIR